MTGLEPEEDRQVDEPFKVDAQVVDRDATGDRACGVADGQAAPQGAEDLLDRVGRGVRTAQDLRLVGIGRRQVSHVDLVAEPAAPHDLGVERRSVGRGIGLELLGEGDDGGGVHAVRQDLGGHG